MRLWLTRVRLEKTLLESNEDGMPVYNKFSDDYRAHRSSWEFFPGDALNGRDFLTRLQYVGGVWNLFILSQREPVRPAWCDPRFFAVKPLREEFLCYRRYRFNLLANPTRKVGGFTEESGARRPILNEEKLLEWLERKGRQHGFRVCEETLFIGKPEDHVFSKGGMIGKHVGVEFSGVLEVVDRELLAQAFVNGIGTAKGFGFGMLMIVPII